ncbi:MAG: hypothetical protein H0U13_17035, partial [Gemmatimonadaceae bacterium]|nr:hypothetical protein [Gemmatimonadaceae bacterium]
MSDAFTSSLFDASASTNALTGGTSQLDTSQIDRNLRQISAVENSWRLPAVPDAVRFDLATAPGMTEPGLLEFMSGLDDDLADDPQPEQTFDPRQRMPQQSGFDQARIILAGVAGNPAP